MPGKFQSFAEQFYLDEATLWKRLGRDLRLIRWMIQTICMWWKARPIRAEFERCRANGLPFYVDRFAGPPGVPPSAPPSVLPDSPGAEGFQPLNPDTLAERRSAGP